MFIYFYLNNEHAKFLTLYSFFENLYFSTNRQKEMIQRNMSPKVMSTWINWNTTQLQKFVVPVTFSCELSDDIYINFFACVLPLVSPTKIRPD